MTVFDLEGNPHEKESVDAKELITECGWTFSAPASVAIAETPEDSDAPRRGRPRVNP